MAEIITVASNAIGLIPDVTLAEGFDPRVTDQDFDFAVCNFLYGMENTIPKTFTNPEATKNDPTAYSPVKNLTGLHINGDPPTTIKERVRNTLHDITVFFHRKNTAEAGSTITTSGKPTTVFQETPHHSPSNPMLQPGP
jgi:hypothetical protein